MALVVSLITPMPALARTSPPAEGEPAQEAPSEVTPEPAPEPAPETPDDTLQPEVTEIENSPPPTGGGIAGAVVDPNDPNATRAQSDLEGEKLDDNVEGVPERLPKLQAAGWWITFGAVALATSGGILSGVAETRQDEAERLAYTFDLETGRATLYGSVADEYESLLRDGEAFQWAARGLIIAGGVTLLAGIAVFAVDGARRRNAKRSGDSARVQLDAGAGGLRLSF